MTLSSAMEKLRASLSCCSYRGDQHTDILVKEDDRGAILKSVKIRSKNGDWFSFSPDRGRGKHALISPLLAIGDAFRHHRACDCVIVVNNDNKISVVYIDLKSTSPKGYRDQFRSTRQFFRYLLGLLEEFHDHKFESIEEHYAVIYGGRPLSIRKSPTSFRGIRKTTPDSPYKKEVGDAAEIFISELLRN